MQNFSTRMAGGGFVLWGGGFWVCRHQSIEEDRFYYDAALAMIERGARGQGPMSVRVIWRRNTIIPELSVAPNWRRMDEFGKCARSRGDLRRRV